MSLPNLWTVSDTLKANNNIHLQNFENIIIKYFFLILLDNIEISCIFSYHLTNYLVNRMVLFGFNGASYMEGISSTTHGACHLSRVSDYDS